MKYLYDLSSALILAGLNKESGAIINLLKTSTQNISVIFPDIINSYILGLGDKDKEISGFVYPKEDRLRAGIYLDDKLVGFMTPREENNNKGWRVGAIFILPEYRRLNIGSRAIKEFFTNKMAAPVPISKDNVASQRAFESAGFIRNTDYPNIVDSDGWIGEWWVKQAAKKKYKEGPSSTFTHNKVTYSVDVAIEKSQDIPVKKVAVAKLKWILKYTKPEKDRVRKADITVPILVAHYGKKLAVVDGLHRLARAIEDDVEYLPIRLLTKSNLAAILKTTLKTTNVGK